VVRPALPEAELWMVAEAPVPAAGVVNLGRVADEDRMAEIYRSAWVFCMPSTYEGFGLPYAEALASGTTVVTTPNPGAVEILRDGQDGVIVPEAELGRALLRVLGDVRERQRWEAAARRRSASYTWEGTLRGYLEVYRRVARSVPGGDQEGDQAGRLEEDERRPEGVPAGQLSEQVAGSDQDPDQR
jgi:phosphatidyl-myo-inositol alpha-mannosyltransferase